MAKHSGELSAKKVWSKGERAKVRKANSTRAAENDLTTLPIV
jgi:hypothetical protein